MAFVERNYQEIVDEILNKIVAEEKISDINIGSVTRTIVEALSREMALLYSH
jgi:ethanolamine utilization protein EutA (predicted chaperonin)